MKINNYLAAYALLILSVLTTSCSNEVDINSDYREISVVYGLIDQGEDQHFVKFTKAFQTDGNVYLETGDPENSQYAADDLEMYFDEYNFGSYVKTVYLDTFLITDKDTGDFYAPEQIVYATPKGTKFGNNSEIRLVAKVKSTGNMIEASTPLVRDFVIVKPTSVTNYADFGGSYPRESKCKPAVNGKLYQLVIRYFYTDVYPSGETAQQHVDWVFYEQRTKSTDGTDKDIIYEYLGSMFYDVLAANIPDPENGLVRWSDSLHYIFSVADEDFTVYKDAHEPSSSIVQDRPEYTNVANGLGIFASRRSKVRFMEGLTPRSLDTLYYGSKTWHLGFEDRPLK